MVRNPPVNAGDARDRDSIPGSERFSGGGHGIPLLYSCLENSMGRGAWQATVHGATKSRTEVSNWVHTHTHNLECQENWHTFAWVFFIDKSSSMVFYYLILLIISSILKWNVQGLAVISCRVFCLFVCLFLIFCICLILRFQSFVIHFIDGDAEDLRDSL